MKHIIICILILPAFLFVGGCEEAMQSDKTLEQSSSKTVIPIEPVRKSGDVTWDDISGRAWIRFTDDGGYDGFYLAPDLNLVLINVSNMHGVKWMINGRMLSFAMQVPGEDDPRILLYTIEFAEGKLRMSYQGSDEPVDYHLAVLSDPFDNSRWEIKHLAGSKNAIPDGDSVYIQFDPNTGRLAGFAGVNRFSGSFKRLGGGYIELGNLAATRMAGPGLAFEQDFLAAVQSSDLALAIGDTLHLYGKGRLKAVFQKLYEDASPPATE
ncbi:META domain protein [Limihaloglobus sulfuriphilus]|uniref:META domain protein n=1 Tax=Limihaloglobus sulfuriphilus TaxID=1851148 RepID=A0A1Q2MGI6_9BACT|nr:META domain-containing protein [Limihaloglobus sulfuriphilus]AQQ71815.1 META domain protein [Limihaloglobus sulfuriphilus]